MGMGCGALCSREKDDINEDDLARLAFVQYIEDQRSNGSMRRTAGMIVQILGQIEPQTNLDDVLQNAFNYWKNKNEFNVTGCNRPMFQYNLQNRNNLIKIEQSIFTTQEKACAIKLQRWWRKKKYTTRRRKGKVSNSLQIYY
ncbi:hypothetical protein pb186bvf_015838 [Paramecium bursaria]